jgi:hypothetical protein
VLTQQGHPSLHFTFAFYFCILLLPCAIGPCHSVLMARLDDAAVAHALANGVDVRGVSRPTRAAPHVQVGMEVSDETTGLSQAAAQIKLSGGDMRSAGEQTQHDVDMDMREANAREHVTEVRDITAMQVSAPDAAAAEHTPDTIRKLIERLGNIGINATRTRLPMKTDQDYDSNDRDTFEFLTIVIGECSVEQLRYEVLRKFRMGSRVVHPDKTAHFPACVIIWTNNMMQLVTNARDEALQRLERMGNNNLASQMSSQCSDTWSSTSRFNNH